MTKKRIGLLLAACSLAGVTVLYASSSWPTAPLSTAGTFQAEWDYDNGNHHVYVQIDRAAYDPATGTVRVSAEVEVDEPGVIRGIWLETCDDTNRNDNIESTEWTTRATGSVTSTVDTTVATVAAFDLDVRYDGYRLRWQWDDGGVAMEEVLAPGLTAD